ncbi:MAG: glycosyltransferase family 4 protein [Planctomycetota bacterium]
MRHFTYVCADPGIPVPGSKGASIHVASVCHAFREAGLDGEVFTLRPEAESMDGLAVHRIEVPPRRKRKSVEDREARLFLASLNSLIAPGNRPDFVYERYSLWHCGGLARARELEIPFILEVNSPLPVEASSFRSLANQDLAEGIAQLLLRDADGIVCVSDEVAKWVVDRRGHRRGVWVIPNGVDPDLFSPRHEPRPRPLPPVGVPLIAFSGSFRPWHGLEDLLVAFRILVSSRVHDAHMVCVGDGPMRQQFEENVRSSGMANRVHITGHLPHQEVPNWLRGADVAVAPYPDLDHFYFSPLKIFEFLSLGLPTISCDVGQVPELLPHQERGLLCAPGNPEELAAAMEQLLNNRLEARRMADRGRRWVLDNATWSKRVSEILTRIDAL